MGINYENAKAIYRVYRLEQRKTKQQKRLTRHPGGPEFASDGLHVYLAGNSALVNLPA